jgi:hypothetical protein
MKSDLYVSMGMWCTMHCSIRVCVFWNNDTKTLDLLIRCLFFIYNACSYYLVYLLNVNVLLNIIMSHIMVTLL